MSLYVVRHEHFAEKCPAGSPEMGTMLLKHVSPQNAQSFGVTLHGEAVLDGRHTFYLIIEAPDEAKVMEYMGPFGQVGSVEVWPASTCEQVVERAKC
ncbi:MAG: DUF3303 family protein [Dehalococcoidia bacterium]